MDYFEKTLALLFFSLAMLVFCFTLSFTIDFCVNHQRMKDLKLDYIKQKIKSLDMGN